MCNCNNSTSKLKKNIIFFALTISCILNNNVSSQIPGWKLYKDKSGNSFFIDRNWKIYANNPVKKSFSPVSLKNLTFKINRADQLMRELKPIEAIHIYRSILVMNSNDYTVRSAKIKASHKINYLKSSQGYRYTLYKKKSEPLAYRIANITTILHTQMRYSISSHKKFIIIRIRKKRDYRYRYIGIVCGIQDSKTPNNKFSMLLAIDAEKMPFPIRSLQQAIQKYNKNNISDSIKQKIIQKSNSSIYYAITNSPKQNFRGYEGVRFKNNYIYFIRIICSNKVFNANKKEMLFILRNFKVI